MPKVIKPLSDVNHRYIDYDLIASHYRKYGFDTFSIVYNDTDINSSISIRLYNTEMKYGVCVGFSTIDLHWIGCDTTQYIIDTIQKQLDGDSYGKTCNNN